MNDTVHLETILVTDKILAAALGAAEHRAVTTHEDINGRFFCVFPITMRLRRDIRRHVAGILQTSTLDLRDNLEEINAHLDTYECQVHAKLRDYYAEQDEE